MVLKEKTCEWTKKVMGKGSTHWYERKTSCGIGGILDTPKNFCPYCGGRIKETEDGQI